MQYLLLKVFPKSHREDCFLFVKSYQMPVTASYWIENKYKADKYSKITTAEQLTENITGGKYAYHSYILPQKSISINISSNADKKKKKRGKNLHK